MPILGLLASAMSGNLFAPSGAYDSIATVTVGVGGQTTVTFSSIPATYKHLQLRWFAPPYNSASGDTGVFLQVGNGSLDTAANYSWHYLKGNGATASADSGVSASSVFFTFMTGSGNSTLYPGVAIVDILDYAATTKYKTFRSLGGMDQNGVVGGQGQLGLFSGNWRSTSAIDTLSFNSPYGNFVQYSSFALYGIKGA